MDKLKKAITCASKVSVGTWVRLAMLLLSMVNMCLMGCGVKTLPFESEQVSQAISVAFAVISALAAYWKNNSFTEAAQAADRVLRGEAEIKEKDDESDA